MPTTKSSSDLPMFAFLDREAIENYLEKWRYRDKDEKYSRCGKTAVTRRVALYKVENNCDSDMRFAPQPSYLTWTSLIVLVLTLLRDYYCRKEYKKRLLHFGVYEKAEGCSHEDLRNQTLPRPDESPANYERAVSLLDEFDCDQDYSVPNRLSMTKVERRSTPLFDVLRSNKGHHSLRFPPGHVSTWTQIGDGDAQGSGLCEVQANVVPHRKRTAYAEMHIRFTRRERRKKEADDADGLKGDTRALSWPWIGAIGSKHTLLNHGELADTTQVK